MEIWKYRNKEKRKRLITLLPYYFITLLLYYFIIFITSSYASFEFKNGGVRAAALAGAYTAVSDDIEAMWWNPAGLRFCKEIQANTVYTNLYGMNDLKYVNFSFVLPTLTAGTWGLGYSSFGPSAYREKDLRLSFSSMLARGIYIGTTLKRNSVYIGNGGGNAGASGVDIGITANISEKLRMAVSAINVNNPALSDTSETLSKRFLFGFQGKLYEGLSTSFDLQKPLEKNLEARIGVELELNKNLYLRAGTQTHPSRFTFGFGINWSIFSLNYAYLTHSVLCSQHMFALKMKFRKQERRRISKKIDEPEDKVSINTGTVDELSRIPGIGNITAKQIIEYREKSGKFQSIRELMNIYGFSETKFDKIKDYITIEEVIEPEEFEEFEEFEEYPEPEESKININEANIKKLNMISGITYPLARNIVKYRKTRGVFKIWEDLLRVPGLNRKILEKIKKSGCLRE